MGEVVELNNYKDMTPSFSIAAHQMEDGAWAVQVIEFYDDRMENHAAFREIAEALIPIAGGLVHNAEEMEPTKRGCIIANISIYRDGYIQFHSSPLDTKEKKAWFCGALDKIKRNVRKG